MHASITLVLLQSLDQDSMAAVPLTTRTPRLGAHRTRHRAFQYVWVSLARGRQVTVEALHNEPGKVTLYLRKQLQRWLTDSAGTFWRQCDVDGATDCTQCILLLPMLPTLPLLVAMHYSNHIHQSQRMEVFRRSADTELCIHNP